MALSGLSSDTCCTKPTNFFLSGQKWSKISKKNFFQKCHEAHQIEQRNVLNAKMYVEGAKNNFFFQWWQQPGTRPPFSCWQKCTYGLLLATHKHLSDVPLQCLCTAITQPSTRGGRGGMDP